MSTAQQFRLDGGADLAQPVGSDQWCTPPRIIEVARRVLGGIDLDAASNQRAQEVVQAAQWYGLDAGRDALVLPWSGRVWCNPPYSRGLISQFADRAVEEWDRGEVVAMIVLVNASVNAAWFGRLLDSADHLIIPSQRINFWNAETGATKTGNEYQQALLAWGLGQRVKLFERELGWRVR